MDNAILPRNRGADPRMLEKKADWIRLETIRLVEIARSGHYSSVFSCAEAERRRSLRLAKKGVKAGGLSRILRMMITPYRSAPHKEIFFRDLTIFESDEMTEKMVKMPLRGRPAFQPTLTQRQRVERLKFVGESDNTIARALGIDPDTLRKHFEDELADGYSNMAESISSSIGNLIGGKTGSLLSSLVNIGLQLGRAGAFGGGVSSFLNGVPAFARGTSFAPGGLSLVGERGPELVNLPRGAQVIPNNKIGAGGIATIVPSKYFDVVVDGRIVRAGPGIAQAGSADAQASMARGADRRLA